MLYDEHSQPRFLLPDPPYGDEVKFTPDLTSSPLSLLSAAIYHSQLAA